MNKFFPCNKIPDIVDMWMLDCKIDHFTNFNKLKQPH